MSGFPQVAPWPPSRHTEPLEPAFRSAADRWLPILHMVWQSAFGHALDDWQTQLVRALLEICPAGHPRAGKLRYRRVLISVARQNGKSEIVAFLGILFLLSRLTPLVIGIASTADQARIVYRRAMQAVLNNKSLKERFVKATDTRGIVTKTGGNWEIKAAKEAALQGLAIDLGIIDEVHLLAFSLWTALVNGTGGRDNCLVVGITTAGNDASELLLDLYKLAESDEAGETFGWFIWEAPEARIPDDDDELGYYLACANPAIADGRVPLDNVIADVRSMPSTDAIRYKLNRFVTGTGGYLTAVQWNRWTLETLPDVPRHGVVFVIERDPDWRYATITATWRTVDGAVFTEVVRSLVKPTPDTLRQAAVDLLRHAPRVVVVDGYSLRGLGNDLKAMGVQVRFATLGDHCSAAALFYRLVIRGAVRHPGDPLLSAQLPAVKRKDVGDGFRLIRSSTSLQIDAVIATMLGVYFTETLTDTPPLLHI